MKRALMFAVIFLLLFGFVAAEAGDTAYITGSTVKNNTNSEDKGDENSNEETISSQVRTKVLTESQIKSIIAAKNRINVTSRAWEYCPYGCTCAGSTVKCQIGSGREMTIYAGNSGNVIVQVKEESMSTNVTLYRAEGRLYGVFRGNQTKEIRMLPDQVKERIRERIQIRLQNENITLNEEGEYEYEAEKEARLLFLFKVRERVTAKINAETGELIRLRERAWWGFLAKDTGEPLLGASCGTVTPGENDACCVNKGFDVWNEEAEQCEFVE